MLTKIVNSFRNIVNGGDQGEINKAKKRNLESYADDDLTSTPVKRARTDLSPGSSFSRFAEWVVRRKNVFSDNYYVQQVLRSPMRMAERLSTFAGGENKGVKNGLHDEHPGPPVRVVHNTGPPPAFATSTPYSGNMAVNMADRSRMPSGIPVNSGGHYGGHIPQSGPGYHFAQARMDINRPGAFTFGQNRPAEGVTPFRAPAPQQPQYVPHNTRSPVTRQPQRGSPNPGNRSMYDKTFSRHKNSSFGRRDARSGKSTANECIRLDEKDRYQQLLKSFTMSSTLAFFKPELRKRSSSKQSNTSQSAQSETLLGSSTKPVTSLFSRSTPVSTPRSVSISSNSSQRSSQSENERASIFGSESQKEKVKMEPNRSLTRPGLSEQSFLTLKDMRTPKQMQKASTKSRPPSDDVITLDDSDDSQSVTPAPVSRVSSATGSIPGSVRATNGSISSPRATPVSTTPVRAVSPSLTKSPTAEEFSQALLDSPFASPDWIENMRSKYAKDVRDKTRKQKEAETKVEFFKEQREQWEESIEQRVRERLRLSEKEPPVLHEDFTDSEDEEDEFPELTDEQESMVNDALTPYPPGEVLCEGFRLQITRKDMETLAGLNWLNDEVINFYMNMLIERGEQEDYPSVHAFNTFFYPKIMSAGHAGVKRWTRKIDVFSKDYILVPVHLGMHWCLSVIDMRKKKICYYDSMGGNNNSCLNALKQYLEDESMDKRKQAFDTSDFQLINVKDIPHQMNGSDCGMFTCKFAEYVTRDAEITFSQEQMPYFRRRIVYEILTKTLL